jgi:protein TonB
LIVRLFFSLFGALFVSIGIFLFLKQMTHINQSELKKSENLRFIDFVRLQKTSEPQKKQRVKPKKPKPLQKPKPKKFVQKQKIKTDIPKVAPMPIDLNIPLNLSAKDLLGNAVVGGGFGKQEVNTNVMPMSRVNPVYPRRAKMMKVEGYVQTEFTITPSGHVKDIVIVKSYPEGTFDVSAKRALIQWTFKPEIENGKAISQRAGITINYRLNQ